MGIFQRKKEDEEYEEELEIKSRKLPKDKAFKDLKPGNKKKRKEPLKPWTKKDRFLIFLLLILTAGMSAYLGLSAREFKLPGFSRLEKPSFNLFGEEKIVIERDKTSEENAQKAVSEFNQKTKNLSGIYGLYVINLSDGYSIGIYEDTVFQAASLIKLPVIAAAYMEEEKGNLDLETKYKLKNSDKVEGAGSLYQKPEGYEISYRDLIRLMGKQSDNTAFRIIRNILGDATINKAAIEIGMGKTSLAKNETTPKDIGIFFEKLWKGEILNTVHKDEILNYLTDTSFESWLAAGVPKEVRVAHKYGREVNVVNDAGVVFAPKPYVVVILSKGVVEREADENFPELSRIIYSNWQNN
jgi:beta-lactamase class A